jgi:hypothetical protein
LEEANDQLSSRAPAHFELQQFALDDDWVGLLKQIANEVKSFNLKSIYIDFYKNLHKATHGAIRPLKQLLIASAVGAILAGKSHLDKESLAYGYMQVFGTDPHSPNVFADD